MVKLERRLLLEVYVSNPPSPLLFAFDADGLIRMITASWLARVYHFDIYQVVW